MTKALLNERASVPEIPFDDFVVDRPDGEVWELIDGRRIMQAQPSVAHQVIAGNVERLLNDAMEAEGDRIAVQATTIDMSDGPGGRYVPDVAVLDADEEGMTRNVSTRCHLAVEVVSPSDHRRDEDGISRIETKVDGYRRLPSCDIIMVIQQDRLEVALHERQDGHWVESRLDAPEDELGLPSVGLRCTLAEIYTRTPALRAASHPVPKGRNLARDRGGIGLKSGPTAHGNKNSESSA